MDLIGISTTVDFKKEILIHLENELNYSLGNNKTKKLQNIESYYLESEVRRILNKFLKSEIGKSHIFQFVFTEWILFNKSCYLFILIKNFIK